MHEGGQALRWRPRGVLRERQGEEEVLESQNGSDFEVLQVLQVLQVMQVIQVRQLLLVLYDQRGARIHR